MIPELEHSAEKRSENLHPRSIIQYRDTIHRNQQYSGAQKRSWIRADRCRSKQACFLDVSRNARVIPNFLGSKVCTLIVVQHISKEYRLLARNHKILLCKQGTQRGCKSDHEATKLVNRQARFIKPLMAEQQRHISCVGDGRNWTHAVIVKSDWTSLSPKSN